jgi:hypothetical protein
MPWMSVTPEGRVDAIFYDYNESTGLMDVDYGQGLSQDAWAATLTP